MIKVFIEYDISSGYWQYYYYDKERYKSSTAGFETHLIAREHAWDVLGFDIDINYK